MINFIFSFQPQVGNMSRGHLAATWRKTLVGGSLFPGDTWRTTLVGGSLCLKDAWRTLGGKPWLGAP